MLSNQRRRKISESSSVESEPEITIDFPSSTSASIRSVRADVHNVEKINDRKYENNEKKRVIAVNNHLNRRKSSVEKSAELKTVKVDALNQLENTIKMADVIEAKNRAILELQVEVKTLKQELKKSHCNLVESRSINQDLMDKLQSLDNINARQKIDLENIRTEGLVNKILDSPVSPDTTYTRYLKDVYENRDRLLEENGDLLQTVEELKQQLDSKQSYIDLIESERKGDIYRNKDIDSTTIEHRSKGDLLKVIRDSMDDKMVWMDYAIKLTQEALARCPLLFGIGHDPRPSEHSEKCCRSDHCRWAKLAVIVLQRVSKSVPQLLREIIKSADPDQIRFIESASR